MTAASTPGLTVTLGLHGQWSGAFDGTLTVKNSGSEVLSDWSVTIDVLYPLRNVSNFSIEQHQRPDGSWQVTLRPPTWGASLQPGASASSYLQGVIPASAPLSSLDPSQVLTSPPISTVPSGSTTPAIQPPPPPAPAPAPAPVPIPVPVPAPVPVPVPAPAPVPTPTPGPATTAPTGSDRWGERFFAPYVDMGLYPVPDLVGLARQYGVGLLTLGFLQATPTDTSGWAGLEALSLSSDHEQARAIRAAIEALRASGGDVMVSMGGAAGTSLAQRYHQSGRDAAALAQAYGAVVNSLGLRQLDFDIEGAAIAEPQTLRLQMQAIALLQQSHTDLAVWLTLPVLPQGLTAEGLNTVRLALEQHARIDGVNVMAMDYGDSAAPPAVKGMGAYAIDAATATHQQLVDLFAAAGQSFSWQQLGVTPMIGYNDVTSEVFTLADAQLLEDFARDNGIGMLSMWSLTRDNPGQVGQVTATHTGLNTPAGGFAAIFGDFGSDPVLTGGERGASVPGPSTATDPITNPGGAVQRQRLTLTSGTTHINAQANVAEDLLISYSWGRQVVIDGFDPRQDRLDLLGFWGEGQQARLVDLGAIGTRIELGFNQQQITLTGVNIGQIGSEQLLIWAG